MKFYSFSEEWIKPSALLVKFQGSRNIHLCCKNFFLTAILCPKSQNPTFLMCIRWSWNLNPSPGRHWEIKSLIFYPPQSLLSCAVCACVCGFDGRSSEVRATAVMRWLAELPLSAALNSRPPRWNMSVPPEPVTINGHTSQIPSHSHYQW